MIFGDGLQVRDFVFVGDVVSALLAAAEHDGGIFNVGSGVETSVLDLYEACAEAAGMAAEPAFEPARLGDLRRSALDVSRAADELGFRAAYPACRGDRPHAGVGDRESRLTAEDSARIWRTRRSRGCTASHATRADPPLEAGHRRREHHRGPRARGAARRRAGSRREAALPRDPAPRRRLRCRDPAAEAARPGDPPDERAGRKGAAARQGEDHGLQRERPFGRCRRRPQAGCRTSATRSRAPRMRATRTTRRAS